MIPANTKKGQLILSIFKPIDLAIFLTGVIVTFILFIITSKMEGESTLFTILSVLPAGICSLLVFPIPSYHNTRVFLSELINFYSNNRRYVWRGWCAVYESKRSEQARK